MGEGMEMWVATNAMVGVSRVCNMFRPSVLGLEIIIVWPYSTTMEQQIAIAIWENKQEVRPSYCYFLDCPVQKLFGVRVGMLGITQPHSHIAT